MSILRANIYSENLTRAVNISVILPIENEKPSDGYKTLYLLNGYMGDDLDWITETRVKRLALENNIAVVMPAGENGFYVDDSKAHRSYGEFVGSELVEITRKMFPLSTKRRDTMIAGLSMGGFGALRNGLKYNQTFGTIGAFSLALVNELSKKAGSVASDTAYVEAIFGVPTAEIEKTDMDPRYILSKLTGEIPKMYIACGTEDFVLEGNQIIHEALNEYNINHTYVTEPGDHNWEFWDRHIELFFEWLK